MQSRFLRFATAPVIAAAAVLYLCLGASAFAQKEEGGMEKRPMKTRRMVERPMEMQWKERDRGRAMERLNLSPETGEKIEKLRLEHRKNRIALRARLQTARVELGSLLRDAEPDEALVMAKQKELHAIRGDLQAAALAHRFAVGKLLTPEQRKILREIRGREHDRGSRREGFGGERRKRIHRRG